MAYLDIPAEQSSPSHFDAVVVGAGFAGLYALHKLRDQLGLRVRVFEAGHGVGGTWFWNQYPGARCDVESLHYSYSFLAELQQEWNWSEKYASQPEILAYLNHVADRFDLRSDISFETRVTSAVWNEHDRVWEIGCGDGSAVTARYLICGSGNLSVPKDPQFDGMENFDGEVYLTGRWPHDGVNFEGKKVAVVGTGSSGIQVITEIAKKADHLTVFQRTPNYATPLRNVPADPERTAAIKANYPQVRENARKTRGGVPDYNPLPSALTVTPEERRRVFDECWDAGGFQLYVGSFQDILIDKSANATISEYIRERISERIDNPALAEKLIPTDYPYGTKRPPFETGYYEIFNQPNVTLVDVRETPIVSVTSGGVLTTDSEHEADILVLATGFDAITGPVLDMGIIGRDGETLNDKWAHGPRTYLGLSVHGFPNLFLVTGPQSPSVLYNMPLAIEDHVDFIADAIEYCRRNGVETIEARLAAEDAWVAHTVELSDATLLPETDAWWMTGGTNGKPRVCMLYIGGAAAYREICAKVVADGYDGFDVSAQRSASFAGTSSRRE
ncbi:MAG: NAD(P)/FAD-dependent oxidoreductase [Rhodococcus sp. (in: high G+C Gram-positive bacteria)]|nr:MAG: NAD(P)/FAD-dependent oxidoreductase [Rhodococcus sp. (in: high G+C Gram-positive bacteria)]